MSTLQIRAKEELVRAFQTDRDEDGLNSQEYLAKLMKSAKERDELVKTNKDLVARVRELESLHTTLEKSIVRKGTNEGSKE